MLDDEPHDKYVPGYTKVFNGKPVKVSGYHVKTRYNHKGNTGHKKRKVGTHACKFMYNHVGLIGEYVDEFLDKADTELDYNYLKKLRQCLTIAHSMCDSWIDEVNESFKGNQKYRIRKEKRWNYHRMQVEKKRQKEREEKACLKDAQTL